MFKDRFIKLLRSLQRPIITIVLGVILSMDVWSLDDWPFRNYGISIPNGWGTPRHSHYPDAYIVKDGNSFSLVKGNFGRNPPTSGVLGEVRYYSTDTKYGCWAMTGLIHSEDFYITTRKPFTAKQNKEVISQYVDRVGKINKQSPEFIALARQGGGTITIILWFGYIHNFTALCLGCIFLVSLGWVPHRIREWRRNSLIAKNLCPMCQYDLRESVEACPECGWQRNNKEIGDCP